MGKLLLGNCLEHLPQLPANSCHLGFVDPPFNIGYGYDKYEDDRPSQEYLDWCLQWLTELRRVLTPTGSFYLASGLKYQAELKVLGSQVGFYWRDTIAWHYTFGPRQESKWTPSWVAIHYFTCDKDNFTWVPEPVRVPSARQLKYNDKRAKAGGKVPDNTWVLLPGESADCFQPGQNAWLHARVCGTFKERTEHPCQMPEAVLERIILASSHPGDIVLDPMAGSGTTLATAQRLGRNYVGIELSPEYMKIIEGRLKKSTTEAKCVLCLVSGCRGGCYRD